MLHDNASVLGRIPDAQAGPGERWNTGNFSTTRVVHADPSSYSNHPRSRPARRKASQIKAATSHGIPSASSLRLPARFFTLTALAFLVLSLLCSTANAEIHDYESRFLGTRKELERLARRGEILMDRREPPMPAAGIYVKPRAPQDDSSNGDATATSSDSSLPASIVPTATATDLTIPSSDSNATATATTIETASSSATQYPLPSPFDTLLNNNFSSQACPTFFNDFLNNATFKSCLPFSMLPLNSNSFFDAERSLVRITQTLDATCNVNQAVCNDLMSSLATQLKSPSNCGTDLSLQQPQVVDAYNGLRSYSPLYSAACLKSPDDANYCFADAITNASSPADAYPYYLPLGVALPGGARPTCNACLQNVMAVFANSANNASMPLSQTYGDAASQMNIACGPNFVRANVVVSNVAAAQSVVGRGWLGMAAAAAAIVWSLVA